MRFVVAGAGGDDEVGGEREREGFLGGEELLGLEGEGGLWEGRGGGVGGVLVE